MDNRVPKHSRKELQRIKDSAKEQEELEKTEPRPGEKILRKVKQVTKQHKQPEGRKKER